MSAELKARFTADASDFNAQVQAINQRLSGLGKLGGGLGVGNITGGLGNILGGFSRLGGFGLAGGVGVASIAAMKAWHGMTEALDMRTKAMESGIPVPELTGFGQSISDAKKRVDQSFRALSATGIGVLLTQGLDAYSDYVTGEMQRSAELYTDSLKRAAQRHEMEARQAAQTAAEMLRQGNEMNAAAARDLSERTGRSKSFFGGVADYKIETVISSLTKSGDLRGAEAVRLSRQFNEQLGGDFYNPGRVLQEFGEMIDSRLQAESPNITPTPDRLSEVVQSSPELTDRLRRIGGGGGGFPAQTTQVFRETLSVDKQILEVQKQIRDAVKSDAGGTVLR